MPQLTSDEVEDLMKYVKGWLTLATNDHTADAIGNVIEALQRVYTGTVALEEDLRKARRKNRALVRQRTGAQKWYGRVTTESAYDPTDDILG